MTLVSIIIPCYNHGAYLQDAVDSVRDINTSYSHEVIIINDGSTDAFTLQKLNQLAGDGYTVLHQQNMGLAAARNNGIAAAKGKYIIPLDSDNKLHQNYLTRAIDILEADATIDVLYADHILFEGKNRLRKAGSFDFARLLSGNHIDACAVVRKSIFEEVGMYDGNMPAMGAEDWELWINVYLNGGVFYYLNEVGFYYRFRKDSMVHSVTTPGTEENKQYIIKKHGYKIFNFYEEQMHKLRILEKEKHKREAYIKKFPLKTIAKVILKKNI